jgi:hypothetical protein
MLTLLAVINVIGSPMLTLLSVTGNVSAAFLYLGANFVPVDN